MSRPESASSMMSSLGSAASARASASRCRCPPLNSPARRDAQSGSRPTSSISFSARSRALCFSLPSRDLQRLRHNLPRRKSGVERRGGILKDHLHRRPRASFILFCRGDGFPSSNISPESAVSKPAMQRASVDFPDPDRPSTATVEPADKARSIPSSDCTTNFLRDSMRFCTNLLLSPRTSSNGAPLAIDRLACVAFAQDFFPGTKCPEHTHPGSPVSFPSCRARLLLLRA